MKKTQKAQLRDSIHRTLVQRAGYVPDANAVAEATLSIWHELAARLTPLIGTRGVYAIFSRSLHLTSFSFPWLAVAADGENSTTQLANLRTSIKSRKPADAAEASHTLLETYIELLAILIGESLTGRLLGSIWMLPSTKSEDVIRP
jgi:hypothetical protein